MFDCLALLSDTLGNVASDALIFSRIGPIWCGSLVFARSSSTTQTKGRQVSSGGPRSRLTTLRLCGAAQVNARENVRSEYLYGGVGWEGVKSDKCVIS